MRPLCFQLHFALNVRLQNVYVRKHFVALSEVSHELSAIEVTIVHSTKLEKTSLSLRRAFILGSKRPRQVFKAYQTKARTSPPTPSLRASLSVITP